MTRKLRLALRTETADLVIALLVVLSLIVGLVNTHYRHLSDLRVQQFTACVAQFDNANRASEVARSMLQQKEADAVTAVILAVADAHTSSDVKNALAEFVSASNLIKREKELNPIPDPPEEVC